MHKYASELPRSNVAKSGIGSTLERGMTLTDFIENLELPTIKFKTKVSIVSVTRFRRCPVHDCGD